MSTSANSSPNPTTAIDRNQPPSALSWRSAKCHLAAFGQSMRKRIEKHETLYTLPVWRPDHFRGFVVVTNDLYNCKTMAQQLKRLEFELAKTHAKLTHPPSSLSQYEQRKILLKLLFINDYASLMFDSPRHVRLFNETVSYCTQLVVELVNGSLTNAADESLLCDRELAYWVIRLSQDQSIKIAGECCRTIFDQLRELITVSNDAYWHCMLMNLVAQRLCVDNATKVQDNTEAAANAVARDNNSVAAYSGDDTQSQRSKSTQRGTFATHTTATDSGITDLRTKALACLHESRTTTAVRLTALACIHKIQALRPHAVIFNDVNFATLLAEPIPPQLVPCLLMLLSKIVEGEPALLNALQESEDLMPILNFFVRRHVEQVEKVLSKSYNFNPTILLALLKFWQTHKPLMMQPKNPKVAAKIEQIVEHTGNLVEFDERVRKSKQNDLERCFATGKFNTSMSRDAYEAVILQAVLLLLTSTNHSGISAANVDLRRKRCVASLRDRLERRSLVSAYSALQCMSVTGVILPFDEPLIRTIENWLRFDETCLTWQFIPKALINSVTVPRHAAFVITRMISLVEYATQKRSNCPPSDISTILETSSCALVTSCFSLLDAYLNAEDDEIEPAQLVLTLIFKCHEFVRSHQVDSFLHAVQRLRHFQPSPVTSASPTSPVFLLPVRLLAAVLDAIPIIHPAQNLNEVPLKFLLAVVEQLGGSTSAVACDLNNSLAGKISLEVQLFKLGELKAQISSHFGPGSSKGAELANGVVRTYEMITRRHQQQFLPRDYSRTHSIAPSARSRQPSCTSATSTLEAPTVISAGEKFAPTPPPATPTAPPVSEPTPPVVLPVVPQRTDNAVAASPVSVKAAEFSFPVKHPAVPFRSSFTLFNQPPPVVGGSKNPKADVQLKLINDVAALRRDISPIIKRIRESGFTLPTTTLPAASSFQKPEVGTSENQPLHGNKHVKTRSSIVNAVSSEFKRHRPTKSNVSNSSAFPHILPQKQSASCNNQQIALEAIRTAAQKLSSTSIATSPAVHKHTVAPIMPKRPQNDTRLAETSDNKTVEKPMGHRASRFRQLRTESSKDEFDDDNAHDENLGRHSPLPPLISTFPLTTQYNVNQALPPATVENRHENNFEEIPTAVAAFTRYSLEDVMATLRGAEETPIVDVMPTASPNVNPFASENTPTAVAQPSSTAFVVFEPLWKADFTDYAEASDNFIAHAAVFTVAAEAEAVENENSQQRNENFITEYSCANHQYNSLPPQQTAQRLAFHNDKWATFPSTHAESTSTHAADSPPFFYAAEQQIPSAVGVLNAEASRKFIEDADDSAAAHHQRRNSAKTKSPLLNPVTGDDPYMPNMISRPAVAKPVENDDQIRPFFSRRASTSSSVMSPVTPSNNPFSSGNGMLTPVKNFHTTDQQSFFPTIHVREQEFDAVDADVLPITPASDSTDSSGKRRKHRESTSSIGRDTHDVSVAALVLQYGSLAAAEQQQQQQQAICKSSTKEVYDFVHFSATCPDLESNPAENNNLLGRSSLFNDNYFDNSATCNGFEDDFVLTNESSSNKKCRMDDNFTNDDADEISVANRAFDSVAARNVESAPQMPVGEQTSSCWWADNEWQNPTQDMFDSLLFPSATNDDDSAGLGNIVQADDALLCNLIRTTENEPPSAAFETDQSYLICSPSTTVCTAVTTTVSETEVVQHGNVL